MGMGLWVASWTYPEKMYPSIPFHTPTEGGGGKTTSVEHRNLSVTHVMPKFYCPSWFCLLDVFLTLTLSSFNFGMKPRGLDMTFHLMKNVIHSSIGRNCESWSFVVHALLTRQPTVLKIRLFWNHLRSSAICNATSDFELCLSQPCLTISQTKKLWRVCWQLFSLTLVQRLP